MITRYFNLNLTAGRSVPLVINVNQYDKNEQWLFTLYDSNNQKYTPSSGAIVGIKSDGLGIVNTGSVDSEGRVVINETEQMTAAVGKAVYELMIDGQTHGTANFIVLVEAKPGNNADLSESDLSLLQEAIDTTSPANIASAVQTWMDDNLDTSSVVDSTLTISGAAADAKVTGDRIGDLTDLVTEDQSSLVSAINETRTDLYNWFSEDLAKVRNIYDGSASDADIHEIQRLEFDTADDADITGLKVISRKEGTSVDTSKFFADTNELFDYVIGDPSDLDGTVVEEISELKSQIAQSTGMSAEFKQALENLVNQVVFKGDDPTGRTYINALHTAMYPPANLTRITAVYTQSGTVYATDSLDSLKSDLVVTAFYDNGTSEIVNAYTLSGTLVVGTSEITVTYGGKSATFNVTVVDWLEVATFTSSQLVQGAFGSGPNTDGKYCDYNSRIRVCETQFIDITNYRGYIFKAEWDSTASATTYYGITSYNSNAMQSVESLANIQSADAKSHGWYESGTEFTMETAVNGTDVETMRINFACGSSKNTNITPAMFDNVVIYAKPGSN